MNCRFDNQPLKTVLIDLGHTPVSNDYLLGEELNKGEVYYPLKVYISETTFLAQLDEFKKSDEIFSKNYAYFSSYSSSWLKHCQVYSENIIEYLKLDKNSFVVEIASNDGYLLKNFVAKQIPCLGVEPSSSVANVAIQNNVPTKIEFFGVNSAKKIAQEYKKSDLIIGNNVFAHVPDINDFVGGLKVLLAPNGTITLEFPHLLQLIENNQFDTIYHEHFWYFSLFAVQKVVEKHLLEVYKVDEISTHGGSLRIYVKHIEDKTKKVGDDVTQLLQKEINYGINKVEYYTDFAKRVEANKLKFWDFVVQAKKDGKKIAGYGAAAKANTLMNYYGLKKDFIDFVVDASPYKQHKFMPGSHVPIVDKSALKLHKPDFVVIFPWNIKNEIMNEISFIKEWGAKFVIPIPNIEIIG
jgi:2-polyprenyl-3-methyl-5-hydroxy-6-metoxy-1,4-benzoquinol methylase